MAIRMTAFDFEYRGWVFEAFLSGRLRTNIGSEGWTVLRREAGRPNIPPCKQILTDRGWETSTAAKGKALVFFDADDLVANCESQIDALKRKPPSDARSRYAPTHEPRFAQQKPYGGTHG